jgi:hypothetical protein
LLLNDLKTNTPFDIPIYLPASRTGFMYAFKTILQGTIENEFSGNRIDKDSNILTLPIIKFLRDLTKFQDPGLDFNGFREVGDFIENNILKGKISIDQKILPNYMYMPNEKLKLPLHVSSSLVSELAPLVMYLKYSTKNFTTIIIEEPESHLHLEMQLMITRAIARLVNKHLFLCITTHSDMILQQINNSIKLYSENRTNNLIKNFIDKNNYINEDFLNYKDVSVYQFDSTDNTYTTVTKLDVNKNGVSVPNFNYILTNTAKQTVNIMEAILENEES